VKATSKKPLIDSVKELLTRINQNKSKFGELAPQGDSVDYTDNDAATAQHKQNGTPSADIRAEFGEFDTYVAFAKAENNGLIRSRGNKCNFSSRQPKNLCNSRALSMISDVLLLPQYIIYEGAAVGEEWLRLL